ncbi:MFS transporter [Actinomadura syzygii]|uniref:MFS transporter n=1 Tax=Actinomadura syzygii TaxID=1427538 RepID=A0A5D0TY17_9ACTN|nr:MFS transporter [Actinomadura syzygii]TYC09789.1 MFS transporter [Actinomadura syzygii]
MTTSHQGVTTAERPGQDRMSRLLMILLAAAVGAAVANRFYIEPLLGLVADEFDVSNAAAGLLVAGANVGYVVGLVLLVPLGDLLDRRWLVTAMLLLAGAVALGCAAAPALPVLALALAGLAMMSVSAQILIPLAASLAGPDERGHVVGFVTSGLLIGTLSARTLSGFAAGIAGFRLIFVVAAVLMVVLAILLNRTLPPTPSMRRTGYWTLLGSVTTLVRSESELRRRMMLAFFQFAGFTVLWTPMAFLLTDSPYDYEATTIGLFGLFGVAGALVAPLAGRLGDRGHSGRTVTISLTVMLASWGLLVLGSTSVIALIVGIVLLDAGFQGAHINHQRTVFAINPEARSRINTAYMLAFFLGGVAGSTSAAFVYNAAGWSGICLLGAGLATAALAVWWITTPRGADDLAESTDNG